MKTLVLVLTIALSIQPRLFGASAAAAESKDVMVVQSPEQLLQASVKQFIDGIAVSVKVYKKGAEIRAGLQQCVTWHKNVQVDWNFDLKQEPIVQALMDTENATDVGWVQLFRTTIKEYIRQRTFLTFHQDTGLGSDEFFGQQVDEKNATLKGNWLLKDPVNIAQKIIVYSQKFIEALIGALDALMLEADMGNLNLGDGAARG